LKPTQLSKNHLTGLDGIETILAIFPLHPVNE